MQTLAHLRSLGSRMWRNKSTLQSAPPAPPVPPPPPLPSAALLAECALRRNRLGHILPPNSVAMLPAQVTPSMSQKIPYRFRQSSDLRYLTAFPEDGALLLVARKSDGEVHSTLLVQPHDPRKELWNGPRISAAHAGPLFGLKARPMTDLKDVLGEIASHGLARVFVDPAAVSALPPAARDFAAHPAVAPAHSVRPLMDGVRLCKSALELQVLQQAADISAAAFQRAMAATQGGVNEHHIDSLLEYECRRQGASFLAYPPVVAGGSRALTMHYVANNQNLVDGELVLVDAGAEFAGYTADISRTWPVNGKFTAPQAELYNIVLEVQQACIAAMSPRTSLAELHSIAIHLFHTRLSALSRHFSPTLADVKVLMPHSIGHYLGLDLHDCPSVGVTTLLQPGTVVTIEPGLYLGNVPSIPAWYRKIGIRIEDDVVISHDPGHPTVVLTRNCPKAVEDVEMACNRKHMG